MTHLARAQTSPAPDDFWLLVSFIVEARELAADKPDQAGVGDDADDAQQIEDPAPAADVLLHPPQRPAVHLAHLQTRGRRAGSTTVAATSSLSALDQQRPCSIMALTGCVHTLM